MIDEELLNLLRSLVSDVQLSDPSFEFTDEWLTNVYISKIKNMLL